MKRLLIVFVAIIISINCSAQAPNWAWGKTPSGNNNNEETKMTTDASGNIYVTGMYFGPTITIGNITLNGGPVSNVFTAKYDSNGNVIWARSSTSLGNNSNSYSFGINLDSFGNIYIYGYYDGINVQFGSLSLTDSINNAINYAPRLFLVKYDNNGNVVWAENSHYINPFFYNPHYASQMNIDINNNIYITGYFQGDTMLFGGMTIVRNNPNSPGNFISKFDSNGNMLWLQFISDSFQSTNLYITPDINGNVYISGAMQANTAFFGSQTLISNGSNDMIIAKYDTNGNELWAHNYGGIRAEGMSQVTFDNANNIIAAGYFESPSITIGNYTLNNVSNGDSSDIFIAKFDVNGNVLWAKSYGGINEEETANICSDNQGNIYVLGWAESRVVLMGTDTLDNSQNFYKSFISKLDSLGNMIWTKGAGDNNYHWVESMIIDSNNNLFVTGYFGSCSIILGNDILTSSTGEQAYFAKLYSYYPHEVWPGDADVNHIVDNTDLLPIGLYYGQTGIARTVQGNVWQADTCADWGISQSSGFDIKHADCNGDGTIDANDTLAVNLNFNLTHAISTPHTNERTTNANLYFVTNANHYNAGDMVDVEVWAGDAANPVSNLYGLAFNISYDASLVQSGTENMTYPSSWLGTPGTDVIKIAKIDALATTAYGAETRINHTNANGFGKIADFRFQVNTALTTPFTMHLAISNYKANDSAGAPRLFNTINDSLLINASTVSVNEAADNSGVTIAPNPFTNQTTLTFYNLQKNTTIKLTDILGKELKTINFTGKQCIIEKGEMKPGVYFIRIEDENKNGVNKKVVIQ